MNVGIDVSAWINQRGFGRFTRELVHALLEVDGRHEYWLFLDAETVRHAQNLPSGSRVHRVIVETSHAASRAAAASGSRSLSDVWRMSRAVERRAREFDLFYFPTIYTFFPVSRKTKVVVTGHDTTAERFPRLIFPNRRAQLFWSVKAHWAYRRADLITAGSESAKRDLLKSFGLPDGAVKVIADGVAPAFRKVEDPADSREVLSRYGLESGDRFFLYVGGISPHKNLGTLVEAFASLVRKRVGADLKLLLVGDYENDVFYSSYHAVREQVDQLGINGRVLFTGFVPDAVLPHLYRTAHLSVLPSFAEGFGLPALESMACGVPVVAGTAGALPEVVGDTGLLFDPHSSVDLEQCLARLLDDEDLRIELGRKALERARTFSWQRTAQQMLAAFEGVRGADGLQRHRYATPDVGHDTH